MMHRQSNKGKEQNSKVNNFKKKNFKVPSKTFLFGEYAVLKGAPAFVLAHEPYFKVDNEAGSKNTPVHELSPAGSFLVKSHMKKEISLFDPHSKRGGFGRSTAEFISALSQTDKGYSAEDVYEEYLKNFSQDETQPSGADLIAQYKNASLVFSRKPFSCEVTSWPFKDINILICYTNNKVQTQGHLNSDLKALDFSRLIEISNALKNDLFKERFKEFIANLKRFSNEQEKLGLIHENTLKVTRLLNENKGVIYARGCGALGADVVAVFVDKDLDKSDLSLSFKELNLDLISII